MAEHLSDSLAGPSRGNLLPAQSVGALVDSGTRWAELDGDPRRRANQNSLSVLIHGLRRHWILSLVSAIVFSGCAAAGAWLWFIPEYSAFTILRVSAYEPKVIPTAGHNETNFEIYKRTQKELMRSRFVLNAALRSPEVERLPEVREQADAVTWLEKRTFVDFPGDAEIMRIAVSDDNAQAAAAIANAVTKAYMQEVVDVERRHRMDRLQSLEKVFNEADEKMRAKHADLKRLAESLGSGDGNALSQKQQNTLQHYATLRNELTKIEFELMRNQLTLAAHEAQMKEPSEPGAPDDEAVTDVVDSQTEITTLKQRIESMKRLITHSETVMVNTKHPRLAKLREGLDEMEKEYQEKYAKTKARVIKDMARRGVVISPIDGLRQQVAVQTMQVKKLNEEVERRSKEADSIGRSSIEVEMMRTELKQVEKLSTRLGEEIDSLRVELRSPSRVIELQGADVPLTRDTASRVRTTCIAGLLGFLLPFLSVTFWDSRSQRVNNAGEIAEGLGMRVVGSLPVLPARAQKLSRQGKPLVPHLQGMLRESFDALRTTLIRGVDGNGGRVVLVTSALSGEGKTTLSTQLAFSFARANRRTLLVDCDLRRPAVHRMFGLPREGGISEVLRGEMQLADAVRATLTPSLWVLSAGSCDHAALSALAQRQMFLGECFQKMREDFEFIIVDCCPVLPVVDSMLIGQHVDVAVLSVMRDVSQVPRVDAANRRLAAMGIRVFGAIVTGATDSVYYNHEYHEELPA